MMRSRELFFAALIVFLPLGPTAAAQWKRFDAAAVPRIALIVPTVNLDLSAVPPLISRIALAATLPVSADRSRADSALTNVPPAGMQRAQDCQRVSAERALTDAGGRGATNDHPANIDFDGSQGGKKRPYQLALEGLRVPSRAVRTANIVAAMSEAAKEDERGQRLLVFAALFREAALTSSSGGSDAGSPLGTLERNPHASALLDGLEKEVLAFDKNLLEAVIAASDLDDLGRSRRGDAVSAAVAASSHLWPARTRLWADRWGRRLSFADQITAFTGTKAEAMRAANGGSRRLLALMEDPFFALVPRPVRAELEKALSFFQEKNGRSPAPPTGRFGNDTAIEIEIDTYPQILNWLTTPDGTVGGLLGDRPAPEPYAEIYETLKALDWDPLPPQTKLALLRYVSKIEKIDFLKDRRIPRVSLKKEVILSFARETTFLGETYPPGRHLVDVSRILGSVVEYRGMPDVEDVSGLEFHFRDNQSAGTVSNDAWTLLDGLGIPRAPQHAHIVAPLPSMELLWNPDVQAAAMTDFYRRVNLLAEMTTIVDEFRSIARHEHGGLIYFSYATPLTMAFVFEYLQAAALFPFPFGDRAKDGWVGFRGSDKYDALRLYGLEYRAIAAGSSAANYREILDRIQQSMMRDDYGIPKEKIKRWLAGQTRPCLALIAACYHQEWPRLFAEAPPDVKKASYGSGSQRRKRLTRRLTKRGLTEQGKEHAELKMLLFDWSHDPLVFEDEAFQKRIVEQQVRALGRFQSGEPIGSLVADFVVESGLYDAVWRSIGPAPSTR